MTIREELQKQLDSVKTLASTLELPDYKGSFSAYGTTNTMSEFNRRCMVISSMLMDIRKGIPTMINKEYRSKFDGR